MLASELLFFSVHLLPFLPVPPWVSRLGRGTLCGPDTPCVCPQCRMECRDVPAETLYDVLHDIEYRKKWDSNVIETFDIARLTVNADVGYYSCEQPQARSQLSAPIQASSPASFSQEGESPPSQEGAQPTLRSLLRPGSSNTRVLRWRGALPGVRRHTHTCSWIHIPHMYTQSRCSPRPRAACSQSYIVRHTYSW